MRNPERKTMFWLCAIFRTIGSFVTATVIVTIHTMGYFIDNISVLGVIALVLYMWMFLP